MKQKHTFAQFPRKTTSDYESESPLVQLVPRDLPPLVIVPKEDKISSSYPYSYS